MLDPKDIEVITVSPYGAGGISVGTNPSQITVKHIPSGLGVFCASERSQHANKEKALALLEALLLAIESEKHIPHKPDSMFGNHWMDVPPPTPHVAGKVQMIKDVREAVGCGLKEAKEAVDKFNDVEMAILHLKMKTPTAPCLMPQGHPTHCGCGEYL